MRHLFRWLPIVGWLLVIAWINFYWFAPASWWISSADITVSDGVAGGPSPSVTISRYAQATILVHWTRILFRETDSEWMPACDLTGAQQVFAGPLTMNTTVIALFEGRVCARSLMPGQYYIEADLEWSDAGTPREIGVESNIFTIAPAERHGPHRATPVPPPASAPVRRRMHPKGPSLPFPFNLLFRR